MASEPLTRAEMRQCPAGGPVYRRWRIARRLGIVMMKIGRKVLLVPVAVVALSLVAACSFGRSWPPWEIHNGTSETLRLAGCAGEPSLERTLAPGGTFTFTDNIGETMLADDPGFACLLMTSHGDLLCLHVPTDQGEKSKFDVAEAVPTSSSSKCFENSGARL